MVDVMKTLDFEYVAANPGSSFRGLHESLVNYGGNRAPEFITCCHEESSVAMAHGYFKVEGKPMAVLAHGTVGLQHAAMAIYNAYCDRVPVYIVAGNSIDATQRRPGVEWDHSVQDAAALVRDFVKWDDLPISLQHFAESAVRAYKIAMTPPMMPVLIVADGGLQEDPISPEAALRIPKLTMAAPPQGDSGRRRRNGEAAGRGGEPRDRRRPARADAAGHDAARRARRAAAGAGHRSGRADEFPVAPSAEPQRPRARARQRGRRDPRPRADGFLGHGQRVSRSAAPDVATDHEARREARQHHGRRSVREVELSGSAALSGGRHRDGRRRRSDAAVAHRGGQARASRPIGNASSRSAAGQLATARQRLLERARTRSDVRLGRQPDQHRAAVGRAVGADQGQRLGAGFADRFREPLADAAVDVRQAVPVHRRVGRRRRRLRRARRGRRGARAQEARPRWSSTSRPTAI